MNPRPAPAAASILLLTAGLVAAAPPSGASDGEMPRAGTVYPVRPGPWGQLEYYLTYLKPPRRHDDQLPRLATLNDRWVLPGMTVEAARAHLREAGLPDEKLTWLAQRSASEDGRLHLFPPDPLIVALTPDERRGLTRFLANWPENPTHLRPLIIPGNDPYAWFLRGGADESLAALAARLTFRLGETLVFTEPGLVARRARSAGDERAFYRATGLSDALVVRLRVDGDADPAALADYWSAGHHRKDLAPILESVLENREVDYLDIVHLLPPLPRKLLNTFPEPAGAYAALDCFWTALNFSSPEDEPPAPLTVSVRERLEAGFEPVESPLKFGDVLLFSHESSGQPVHAAVFIAHGIVFTKNGASICRPWVFMRTDQMLKLYSLHGPLRVRFFRRK